jgi:hypothetical protein
MKKYIIRRIFITVAAMLSTGIGGAVVTGHQWLAIHAPAIAAMIDPWTATTLAYGLTIGLLMWAIGKWQGIPIAELQTALAEKGLYHGRIDGLAGAKTQAAIAEAINDPSVTIYPARPVAEGEEMEHQPAKKPKFQRPQGSKML